MQGSCWAALLQYIPASEHTKLMLVTTSGVEIALQSILRVDAECVAIKGRLAGSTDAGRVFFIPYDRIDYFGFQQAVKESEFNELFSGFSFPAGSPDGAEADPAEASRQPGIVLPSSPTVTQRTPVPIKSAVLEKFRSRLSTSGMPSPIRPPDEGQ